MKNLTLLLIAFLFINCSNQEEGKTTASSNSNSTLLIDKVGTASLDSLSVKNQQEKDTSFQSFLTRFSADSQFQLSRVDFPLTIKLLDIMDNEEVIQLEKDEWVYLDLLDTAGANSRPIDAYALSTRLVDSLAYLQLRGVDNGIRIDYIFHKREEKWYLVEEFNASN